GFQRVGDVLGASQEARALVAALRARADAVATRVRGLPTPSVACIEWIDPVFAMGNWGPELVALAGGRSVLGQAAARSTTTAGAADNPASCVNDIDCIATPACGGDLCDWEQALKCKPAGGANKGWCMADSDCKCPGAKCTTEFHCTITQPAASGAAGTTGSA